MNVLSVLIVEDQPAVATALEVLFEIHGLRTQSARGPAEALALLDRGGVGVVVQDMNFSPDETSGREGTELFRRIRALRPDLPVLALTAWTSLETAVALVKEGAADYLAKPWDDEQLAATVKALLAAQAARGRDAPAERRDLCGAVFASRAMHELVELALQVAAADVPVLITGPSGAGKEKIAEIVQAHSPRRDRPFVRVNAGALPDELLESELFGAEIGAYTGADRRRIGRFEAAHRGTLFLDEIGNLSPSGQRKLLRVLQSGELARLGSSQTMKVDVRLLCATNADLRAEVAAGRFREDLYYRLNVVELAVPPLVARPDDVLPLAERFLATHPRAGGRRARLSEAAATALLAHSWPGNVRELSNVLQRAVLLATSDHLEPVDLRLEPVSQSAAAAPERTGSSAMDAAEHARLERVLAEEGGIVAKAAERLGLSRQALYRKMEKHGIAVERRVRG